MILKRPSFIRRQIGVSGRRGGEGARRDGGGRRRVWEEGEWRVGVGEIGGIQVEVYNNQGIEEFLSSTMNICYNQHFLQQAVPPYVYFLAYLPTSTAQNNSPSTFLPLALQEQPQPYYPIIALPECWNPLTLVHTPLPSLPVRKDDSGRAAIQPFSGGLREEQAGSKAMQKQSRNVLSNLLRILFKNILEVRMYEELILRVIAHHHLATSLEDFYRWLQGYGVNYKNYIRFCAVKKIMTAKKRKDHLAIFKVLLHQYIKVGAITHCLTSKRIDRASMEMHLVGLRQLKKDLLSE